MLNFEQIVFIAIGVILFALFSSLLNIRYLNSQTKIITLLLSVTLLNEALAIYSAYHFHNSNIVYGFFSPIELFIISLYFNNSTAAFKKKHIGIIIGIIGIVIGYLDYFIIQSPSTINNFFLLFESVVVVAMCLFSLFSIFAADNNLRILRHPHFWFTCIFLFFWTSTLFVWGTYDYLTKKAGIANDIILFVLLIVNIITYLGFGTVFLLYRKMQKNHE